MAEADLHYRWSQVHGRAGSTHTVPRGGKGTQRTPQLASLDVRDVFIGDGSLTDCPASEEICLRPIRSTAGQGHRTGLAPCKLFQGAELNPTNVTACLYGRPPCVYRRREFGSVAPQMHEQTLLRPNCSKCTVPPATDPCQG